MKVFTLFSAAAALTNFAVALPHPGGGLSQQSNSGYGSSKDKSGSSYGSSNNSGYGSSSSKDKNSGSYDNNNGYGSSESSGGYGSSESSSAYGSSEGNKGSNNSGYGDSNGSTTSTSSSTMMTESTSTAKFESTSTMMSESTTSTSMMSETTSATYGSGSSNWGAYNDCVQQCIASFAPSSTATYSPNQNSGSSGSAGSSGTGATKTVIVAPTQGTLRYIPFAMNASVGDTIVFMWGANNHTVTKSSALEPCNKTSDALFASGTQNQGFMFSQVVNDTNPTFYYCATPGHCGKGMFGVINAASNIDAPTSASGMMQALAANSTDLKTYAAITDKATQGTAAGQWGGSIDLSGFPQWAQPLVAENILYTRNVLAMNPEYLQEDGTVDISSVSTTPMMIPLDIPKALAAAATSSSASASATGSVVANAGAASTTPASAAATSAPPTSNGAGTLTLPSVLMTVVIALFTIISI